jgi:peptidyl-prolyl cis-trans isomerase B (cyclophilin B)
MNYPQQPGQPYPPQQQYGQYPQQQYPGYPQPPKKGNGLLIGLLAGGGALLLVVVFVITAFVAPGFLLPAKPKVASGPPLDLNSGSVVAGKFILAVMGDDPDRAEQAACASAKSQVRDEATKLGSANAQITAGEPTLGLNDRIMVKLSGSMSGGRELVGQMTVQREPNGTYCIYELTTSAT